MVSRIILESWIIESHAGLTERLHRDGLATQPVQHGSSPDSLGPEAYPSAGVRLPIQWHLVQCHLELSEHLQTPLLPVTESTHLLGELRVLGNLFGDGVHCARTLFYE